MITKFKMFESVSELPKVGDYVLINRDFFSKEVSSFFEKNFGQVTYIEKSFTPYDYHIKFNIPEKVLPQILLNILDFLNAKIKDNEFTMKLTIHKIDYWSNNKEELEDFLVSNKYNL